ncbi:MAG: DUF554 domain-containing protein [Lachnospiraceae bacterium]|nr:DUF554 domain-containing protein [Lachnospiraceae bacterium]
MRGLGTLLNMALIVAGGLLGMAGGSRLKENLRETLMTANAVAVLFVGMGGALSKMLVMENGQLQTNGTMMMIISMSVGALLGELLDLDGKFVRFGEWLKIRTGNSRDAGFVGAFVTASLTVCIGAMAIVGSIEDGINGDYSILLAKGVLDFVIILVMTSSLGKGALFSFIPVGIFQGSVTLLAGAARPLITEAAMSNLSYVGSILIFCVGVNLLFDKRIRVANLLPAIFAAAAMAFFI